MIFLRLTIMNKFILILLLLISSFVYSQTITSTIVKDTITNGKPIYMNPKAGSCGSPDGAMNVIAVAPPSYAWLQANGYCNPASYGTNPTVCWTFVPSSTSVTINSGYSTTGCVNISHGPFNLYNAGCTLIGTGLNFTGLTIGATYTWCMTSSAWGGANCIGFTDYCPYFFNNVVLPIELEDFGGYNKGNVNHLYWVTATEINNDYFTIERSKEGDIWYEIAIIPGGGNLNTPSLYEFDDYSYEDGLNYYRLTQTDFNGAFETFEMIAINKSSNIPWQDYIIINLLGQEVPLDYSGIRIIIFEDGRRALIPAGMINPRITR